MAKTACIIKINLDGTFDGLPANESREYTTSIDLNEITCQAKFKELASKFLPSYFNWEYGLISAHDVHGFPLKYNDGEDKGKLLRASFYKVN